MNRCIRLLTLLACCLALPGTVAAQAYTLRDLLIKVPDEANSLVVIYVPGLHRSPLGRQENWAKKHEAAFLAGKVPFPPQTIMLVLAGRSSTDPQGAHHEREIGLLSLSKSSPFDQVAQYEQGIIEQVASQKVILTPRRVYIAPLSQRLIAVQRPADRQELSRWLQFAKRNKNPVLNDWLNDAANEMDKAGQVIMALHLEDTVDVRRVRQRLGEAQPPLPKEVNLDTLAEALASVRGLRLAVQVKDDIQGEIRIEFNKPVKAFANLLHPLLTRGVENLGEAFPSIKDWQMQVEDQVVTFRSPMTNDAFAALLASIGTHAAAPAGIAAGDEVPGGDKGFSARRYYQQVQMQLDDLNKKMARTSDYNVAAKEHEDCALRIERLPAYDVDEDLMAYATGLSGKLRTIAESLRGVPITAAVLEASRKETFYYQPPRYVNTGGWTGRRGPGGGGGLWGGGGGMYVPQQAYYDSNLPELRGKLAEAIAKDQMSREKIWKTIETDTTRIRDKMTQKYGGEFK